MSQSESVLGPFKRGAWDFKNSPSHSAIIPAGFHKQKLWGLLFPPLELWAGGSGVGLGFLTPYEVLYSREPLLGFVLFLLKILFIYF